MTYCSINAVLGSYVASAVIVGLIETRQIGNAKVVGALDVPLPASASFRKTRDRRLKSMKTILGKDTGMIWRCWFQRDHG